MRISSRGLLASVRNSSRLLIAAKRALACSSAPVQEYEVYKHPLVILNACRTGTMDPSIVSNWAHQFRKRGARGVVAIEFSVPDWFAAAFIRELYKYLFKGVPLGESILKTRQHFWGKNGNPLGLAYALYSSPLIKLDRINA